MAKKKETNKTEDVHEDLVLETVDMKEEETAGTGRKWTEEIESAGNEVAGYLKRVWYAGKTRRIVVKNQADDTVLNVPLMAGALGLIPPLTVPIVAIAGVGTVAALLNKCSIAIEHRELEKEPEAV